MINKLKLIRGRVVQAVRSNFRAATTNFIFIFVFVNLMQSLFGPENSIVGVILAVIMMSSMLRDFTLAPVRHFIRQLFILESMTVSAFLVISLNPYLAVPINFVMLLFLLYSLTFEYAADLYAPYILSYLFLIFISPVNAHSLPKRMLAMLVGAFCIILFQLVKGRNRSHRTVREALITMIGETRQCIQCLLLGEGLPDSPTAVRENLYKLAHLVDEHRKSSLHISDAGLAMLNCGLELDKLIRVFYEFEGPVTPGCVAILQQTAAKLDLIEAAVVQKGDILKPLDPHDFLVEEQILGEKIYHSLVTIEDSLHSMLSKKKITSRQTVCSLSARFQAAISASPVRIVYALRVAMLLTVLTLLVLTLHLPHGKWLLYTVASVSLPYANDVAPKIKKRLFGTVLGGSLSAVAFICIPSMVGRTIVIMFFGYLTAYFSDYKFVFTCATVGGLGGAVLMGAFGWSGVGGMFLVRLGYICLGVAVAYIFNCVVFPFNRCTAVKQLWKSYLHTTQALCYLYPRRALEPQLYYKLVVRELLQAEKLQAQIGFDDRTQILSVLEHKFGASASRRWAVSVGDL